MLHGLSPRASPGIDVPIIASSFVFDKRLGGSRIEERALAQFGGENGEGGQVQSIIPSYNLRYHSASQAVSYTMRREGAGVKQVRRVGQSETIGNVHKALQHVMLAPGDNLFK
jgi:hypothetical protein